MDFRERKGKERAREKEKHRLEASPKCPNLGSNLSLFGAWIDASTNEPHWPGL